MTKKVKKNHIILEENYTLFNYLFANNSEILKRFSGFLEELGCIEDYTYVLNPFTLKTTHANSEVTRHHFNIFLKVIDVDFDIGFKDFEYDITSVYIEFSGHKIETEKLYKKKFFGGTEPYQIQKVVIETYRYFPFVSDFDKITTEYKETLKKEIKEDRLFLNQNNFIKKIKNLVKEQKIDKIEFDKIDSVFKFINETISQYNKQCIKAEGNVTEEIQKLDVDANGLIDVIEGGDDFLNLLKKYQSNIIEVDRSYVQHFVKLSNYLRTKRDNLQQIFLSLKELSDVSEMEKYSDILKNSIHSYELLLFHSINMITSLVDDDMITFYEIYESLDKLNIFNSNWENEVSQKLGEIGDGLQSLMSQVHQMEINVSNRLENLSYVTQESFKNLNKSVTRELRGIESSMKFNNLLTSVQTYQMYKINKQTKNLI